MTVIGIKDAWKWVLIDLLDRQIIIIFQLIITVCIRLLFVEANIFLLFKIII